MRKLAVLIEVSISTAAEDKGSYHDFQKFHLLWIGRRAPVDSTVSHNLHSNQAKATKNTLPWFMITVLTGHLRSHGERIMALSELLACFSHAQGVLWQQRVTQYWDYIVTPRVPLLKHAGLLLWIGKLFLTLKWNKWVRKTGDCVHQPPGWETCSLMRTSLISVTGPWVLCSQHT